MHTKIRFVDYAGQGKGIEELNNSLINVLRVFAKAFLSEIVLFSHYFGLVIASQQDYSLLVLYL